MLRLTYLSTLAPTVPLDELDRIIEHARQQNPHRDVTGMLAIEGRRICQILEGPEEAVERLFSRIQADPRHQGVTLLDQQTITKRRYAGWAMEKRTMVDVVMLAFAA